MTTAKKAKPIPHAATITLTGEIVQAGQVITPVATEWPKVACKVLVRHNADQATVFVVVAVGPIAEQIMHMRRGLVVKVGGPIKCSTGSLEVFATSFEKAKNEGRVGYVSLASMMFGGPTPPPESEDDDDDD